MKKLNIIYEDKNLLVIDKPPKQLTIKTNKNESHTLYEEASLYVKKQYPKNKVFIVNRLDKDTSGLVVFAKNETLKKELQDNWNNLARRYYIAIVEGNMPSTKGKLKSYLKEDNYLKTHSTNNPQTGKLAITNYEVIDKVNGYNTLRINIETGRKNQIRAQLSETSHPIVGDKKYNAHKNPLSRLGLHAYFLELNVPGYKEPLKLITKIPESFKPYIRKESLWKEFKK